jgi:hypothetical protein
MGKLRKRIKKGRRSLNESFQRSSQKKNYLETLIGKL